MKKVLFLLSLLITQQITLSMHQENQIILATPSALQIKDIIRHGTSQQVENLSLEHLDLEQINSLKNFGNHEMRRINLRNQQITRDLYIGPGQLVGTGIIGQLARQIPAYANVVYNISLRENPNSNESALLIADKFLNYFLGCGFIAAGIGLMGYRLYLKEEMKNNNKLLSNIQSLNEGILLMRFKRAPVKSD